MSWIPVLLTVAGCFVLKLLGTLLPTRVLNDRRVTAMAALVPVSLLAAIIALQTLTTQRHYAVDARLGGMVAAAVAVAIKAPFVVVVVAAAATAALIRTIG